MKIIPSIASASQLDLKCQLDRIRDVPYIHIDVEDGNFLPNITFGMKTVKEMAAYSKGRTGRSSFDDKSNQIYSRTIKKRHICCLRTYGGPSVPIGILT